MTRPLILAVAVVAVVSAALAACGDTSKTITVGTLYPRTGPQGPGGGDVRDALHERAAPYGRRRAQAALEAIKCSGLVSAGSFPYDANVKAFGPLLAQIGAARPDVVFSAAYVDDGVDGRKALVTSK